MQKRRTLIAGILLGLSSMSSMANDTAGVMAMVNRAMADANRATNPQTSMAEVQRIQRHYDGWNNRYGGMVREMEMRNRLAQRQAWERARRQSEVERSQQVEAYIDARRRARGASDVYYRGQSILNGYRR